MTLDARRVDAAITRFDIRLGGASQPATASGASQPASKTAEILQQVRDLGRSPKENAGRSRAERQLAEKLRRAQNAMQFSPEQEAELQALQQAAKDAIAEPRIARADELMQQVRDFGRCPKENERCSLAERQAARRRLVGKLRWARKTKLLSPEQEAELQALRHVLQSGEALGHHRAGLQHQKTISIKCCVIPFLHGHPEAAVLDAAQGAFSVRQGGVGALQVLDLLLLRRKLLRLVLVGTRFRQDLHDLPMPIHINK